MKTIRCNLIKQCQIFATFTESIYKYMGILSLKGALSWYGKLTWECAQAWNLIILCLLIVWGMTFIFMVHLSFLFYSIANS